MTRSFRWPLGLLLLAAYIATVVVANWAIHKWGVVPVGFGLMAPAAVYFAGLAFTFRDLAQDALMPPNPTHAERRRGLLVMLAAIAAGAALSYVVTANNAAVPGLPSPARLALASMAAFAFSELADFIVYTPLRERDWLGAVLASNLVGLLIDSLLFLWLAFGSLEFLRGQLWGKTLVTLIALPVLYVLRRPWRRAVGYPAPATG